MTFSTYTRHRGEEAGFQFGLYFPDAIQVYPNNLGPLNILTHSGIHYYSGSSFILLRYRDFFIKKESERIYTIIICQLKIKLRKEIKGREKR